MRSLQGRTEPGAVVALKYSDFVMKKYAGAYAAGLDGLDAVVSTWVMPIDAGLMIAQHTPALVRT
jgi:acetate kinase